jgi:3-deoxy-7-phosphoheptulonate synthase
MIIVLKPGTSRRQAHALRAAIEALGLQAHYLPGTERTVIGAIGDERPLASLHLEDHPLVASVKPILAPYKLVSRELQPDDTVVHIGSMSIGGSRFASIAGPCVIESREQLRACARAVKRAGATALRAAAFTSCTNPYSFQGLGLEGLAILREVAGEVGLPAITEVVEASQIDAALEYVDALQIGSRNMQNVGLLRAAGASGKPVLLKRGTSATVTDLLLAAECIVATGNSEVVLCERGIRTFETATRHTLDLGVVPYIKQHSHLPVLVDPSHATGVRELISPMARAAAACGADGIMVEVHPNPAAAQSDGAHSLYPEQFDELMIGLRPFVEAAGRTLEGTPSRTPTRRPEKRTESAVRRRSTLIPRRVAAG